MSYRSLLVLLDSSPRCAERVSLAIDLARAVDGHLVGLAPTGLVDYPVAIEAAAMLEDFAAQARAALLDEARRVAGQFDASCRARGLTSFESVLAEEDRAAALLRWARCADLTVIGQPDPDSADRARSAEIVDQAILHSARPSLIVPYAGRFVMPPQRALVAWDDSREAARALSDALPLLQRCERVDVIRWNEGADDADESSGVRLEALQGWLARHGVRARTAVETTDFGVAEAMLSRAADLDAQLLVMGAWGHQRWTERLLGGATRGLLSAMTLPVLMSH
jgi:nucleotide-binding universal stress UspA family protein